MIKVLYFLLCLLIMVNPAYAEKSEWIDPSYDFTKTKSICINYVASPEIADGIRDKESQDLFFEKAKADIADKLSKQKYKVDTIYKAKENFITNERTDSIESAKDITQEQLPLFEKYVQNNYDLLIKCTVSQYDTGKKYMEAHTYKTMVPVATTVLDATGQMQTIIIQQQQEFNIPAGNYPAAFVQVRFDAIDTKTNQKVWSLEDKRDMIDETGISDIKPNGLFTQVIAEFAENLRKNLKSRRPVEKKI
ncbi:MAG: hypothetical protein J6M57_09245 [Acidaminococcaceae bacterium]|nr:hypothetical protein [Acidaminococcaceae bacterium]